MSAELTGRRLGSYQLHERIGAGGMGEVYRATDTKLGLQPQPSQAWRLPTPELGTPTAFIQNAPAPTNNLLRTERA